MYNPTANLLAIGLIFFSSAILGAMAGVWLVWKIKKEKIDRKYYGMDRDLIDHYLYWRDDSKEDET